jgi:hypothetical protein
MRREVWLGALCLACASCGPVASKAVQPGKPELVLWAWDRAEDLTFLRPGEAKVAAWVRTLRFHDGQYSFRDRQLPLQLPPGLEPIRVIRMESDGTGLPKYEDFLHQVIDYWPMPNRKRLGPVQLDFDARESEREWYRGLLVKMAAEGHPASITALASWCLDRPWFASDRASLSEVVPMLYDMGPRQNELYSRLYRQKDLAPACRGTIGVATDQIPQWLPPAKTIYVFHHKRWDREAFDTVCKKLSACLPSSAR